MSPEMVSGQTYREPYSASQKSDDGMLIAYPNPARDFIYLKTKNPLLKVKSVYFYSILGNQVAEYYVDASFSEIRLDRLKSGKYLMRYILSDNTQKVTQIIKQ
jgi:hypothetical protein